MIIRRGKFARNSARRWESSCNNIFARPFAEFTGNPWPHNPADDFMKISRRCKRRRHNGCKGKYVRKRFPLSKSIWIYDIGCNTTWTQTLAGSTLPLNHLKPVTLLRKHVRSASFIYFHVLYFPFPAATASPRLYEWTCRNKLWVSFITTLHYLSKENGTWRTAFYVDKSRGLQRRNRFIRPARLVLLAEAIDSMGNSVSTFTLRRVSMTD